MEKRKIDYMQSIKNMNHIALGKHLIQWIFFGSVVGILSGIASTIFLKSLEYVTEVRIEHPWLLFCLPIGGAFVSFMYWKYGKTAGKGNNLVLEQIHKRDGGIPIRMGIFVLGGSLITHLFGGSAGREGTAVQMSSSLAEYVGTLFKLDETDRRIILMCGISSGFASVFGTPLAGTIFGMEIIMLGFMTYEALIPCFVASMVGNLVTSSLGVHHSLYPQIQAPELSLLLVVKVLIASILFGLASIMFSELTHGFKHLFTKCFKNPMIKSAVGGVIVIALVYIVGTRDYIGLSVDVIGQAFKGEVPRFAFLWKTIFTSITLGSGFQGGEVTPLFFLGSTLGNSLSGIFHLSPIFLASLGFVAVFAGAANTPITCFVLGIELFGSDAAIYFLMACIISYLFSGHHGIYTSQGIGRSKSKHIFIKENATLATAKLKE